MLFLSNIIANIILSAHLVSCSNYDISYHEELLATTHQFALKVQKDHELRRELSETNAECLNDVCLYMQSFTTCEVIF